MKKRMKKNVRFMKLLCAFFVVQLLFVSCKKDNEPVPEGRLIFYTQINAKEFDAIDIYVDKKFAGKLISPNSKRPDCNQPTIGNTVYINLPVGEHSWSAKQYLGGKEIDEWDERTEKITANDCEHIKLTE